MNSVKEDFRWFAPSDRGIPEARFADVTVEIDLGDIDVDVVDDNDDITVTGDMPPAVLPQPAHRIKTPLPAGVHRDAPFSELNVILREMRAILASRSGMLESEIDAVEWQLRAKIAKL
jgi:hypothetical protein